MAHGGDAPSGIRRRVRRIQGGAIPGRSKVTKLSRRRFLRFAAGAGAVLFAPLVVPARILGRDGAVAPSERIALGGIGINNRGMVVLGFMLAEKDVRFAAICDVRADRREAVKAVADARNGNRDCATYRDLRELLARPDIDAVLIATGDRWHTLASIPADNRPTVERIDLGRKLYFDLSLSRDGTVSCATCHDVTRGFTDQRPVSEGIGNQEGKRKAPTTLNVALLQTLFLDGRSPSLEHQAKLPIINPIEMGLPDGAAAVAAISKDAAYAGLFQKAYGRPVNYEDMGRALAAFQRTLNFLDSPLRRFLDGKESAISPEARRGWVLFNGKARCATCHPMSPSQPLGTDDRYHNIGVSARHRDFESLARQALKAIQDDASEKKLDELALSTDLGELGRFMVSHNRADIGSFRTPLLLNAGITPPYMHDGSMATLWDVVDHYNKGGEANPFLDGGIEPLALTEEETDEMVALLFSLTDDRFAAENRAQMGLQKERALKERPNRDIDQAMRRKLPFAVRLQDRAGTRK